MKRYSLTVTSDFFDSDFVPQVCLFSGATVGLRRIRCKIDYEGYGASEWWKWNRAVTPKAWHDSIHIPARGWSHFSYMLAHVIHLFGVGATIFLALPLICMGLPALFERNNAISLSIVAGYAIAFALAGLVWVFGGWRIYRAHLYIEALPEPHHIELRFPARLKPVFDLYIAAWRSYDQAGRPPPRPQPKSGDEGWEDSVRPGWDEKQS